MDALKYVVVALEPPNYNEKRDETGSDDPIAEDAALGLLLHYHVPDSLNTGVQVGQMVVVPLRDKPVYGVVVEISDSSPVDTRPISRIVDAHPVVPPAMMELARWIAGYYRCTLWQAL